MALFFGGKIRDARKAAGLTQRQLAEKIGVTNTSVSNWEKNLSRPDPDTIANICDALSIAPNYLFGAVSPDLSNILPMPETKKVPRLGRIACGEPILAEENIEDYDEVPAYVKADFTLVCKGDSMKNARIYDGDIVCIRQQEQVENGEIAAVLVEGEAATLKRVRIYPDHIVLEPENPDYKPLSFWEEDMNKVKIIGKATHFISVVK